MTLALVVAVGVLLMVGLCFLEDIGRWLKGRR